MTYTINHNTTFKSLEITFDKKPPEQILNTLKTLKFRWHGVKRLWYGFADETALRKALGESIPEAPKTEAPKATAPKAPETPKAPEVIKDKRTGKIKYYKAIMQNGKKSFIESWGKPLTIELSDRKLICACECFKPDGWKITDTATGMLMQQGEIKTLKALTEYIKTPNYIEAVARVTATESYKKSALELTEYLNQFKENV